MIGRGGGVDGTGQVSGCNLELVTSETYVCSINRHIKKSVSSAFLSIRHLSPFASQMYIP